jgi:hypothetical protein
MNGHRVKLLLVGLFLATVTRADLAPMRISPPEDPPPWIKGRRFPVRVSRLKSHFIHAGVPIVTPAENVLLRLADVSIQLSPAVDADLAEASRACGRIEERPGRRWVVADVSCEFEIARVGSGDPRVGFWIGFPIRSLEDPVSHVSRFLVETDGNQRPVTKPLPNYTVTTPAEPEPTAVTYEGRYWFCVLKDVLPIRVTYRLLLPVDDGRAFFRYVLRSGGKWSAPLGKEIVTVAAAAPLKVQPLEASTLEPVARANGGFRWTLLNARPAEDIKLLISTNGTHGQIASASRDASVVAGVKAAQPLPDNMALYWGLGVFICAGLGFMAYLSLNTQAWAEYE